jgi:hypothetical protein
MPPMPPPWAVPARADSFFGRSATIASVVISSPATEAAYFSAHRTTLVGSMMPASTRSLYSPCWASKPQLLFLLSSSLPITIEPSAPAFSATRRAGNLSARLPSRCWKG